MKANAIKQDAVKSSDNRTPFFTNSKTDSFFASSDLNSQMSVQMQPEEEEEPVQTQRTGNLQMQEEEEEMIQTQPMEEEEEMVQPKMQGAQTINKIQQTARTGFLGSPVAYPFFHQIQTSFGKHDISGIQSYRDSNSRNANRKMGSLAYASGNKVAFRGSPTLHTAAHEAAHVVQQRKGVSLKSGVGKPGDSYEQHADAVADLVVRGKSAENLLSNIQDSKSVMTNAIQFTNTNAGADLGTFWDMYVYPGNHPGAAQGVKNTGRQVRSFQRLHNRSSHREEGQRIIDVNDRSLAASQTLTDSEQITQPEESGPREWNIDLTTHELFDPQPELADVIQNAIGDCYLLATLQGMAARGGGRTQLTNAVNETESGYSVEFYRPQIVGGQAIVDANSRIRVSLGRGYDPRGVQLREKNEIMSDTDARQLLIENGYESQLQDGDTINVWWTKRIVWPWAIERAYAAVCGGLSRMEGGFSALPIMVLTGEIPRHIYNYSSFSIADISLMLSTMNSLVDNDTIITTGTYANLDTIYSRSFILEGADETNGLRFRGLDGIVTSWIPWGQISNYIANFVILDPLGYAEGRPIISNKADYSDWEQALIDASSRSGVLITGTFATLCLGQGLVLVPAHEYSVTSVSASGAQTSNPWAALHPGLVTPAQIRRAFQLITFKV